MVSAKVRIELALITTVANLVDRYSGSFVRYHNRGVSPRQWCPKSGELTSDETYGWLDFQDVWGMSFWL